MSKKVGLSADPLMKCHVACVSNYVLLCAALPPEFFRGRFVQGLKIVQTTLGLGRSESGWLEI